MDAKDTDLLGYLSIVRDPRIERKKLHLRNYLHRFVLWWTKTTKIWNYAELLIQFCSACYDIQPIAIARQLVSKHLNKSHTCVDYVRGPVDEFGAVRGVV